MENLEQNVNVNEETQIEKDEQLNNEVENNVAAENEEKMIPQSKVEEIINKKYAKMMKKIEEEKEAAATKAREAAKLEKMSENERTLAKIAQLEEKLAQKEAAEARKDLTNATLKELSVRGIDSDFLDFVIAEDAEKTKEKLDIFDKKFNAMVDAKAEAMVKERLRGNAPVTGTSTGKELSAFEMAFRD